eukprot:IDg13185t1
MNPERQIRRADPTRKTNDQHKGRAMHVCEMRDLSISSTMARINRRVENDSRGVPAAGIGEALNAADEICALHFKVLYRAQKKRSQSIELARFA